MNLQLIKKNVLLNIFFLVIIIGLCALSPFEKVEYSSGNTGNNYIDQAAVVGMANPSAVYCNELGYQYQKDEDVCVFEDDVKCDAWEFLKGKCGKKYSYCVKMGFDIETINDGKNAFSSEYAVCVDKNLNSKNLNSTKINKVSVTDLFQLNEKTRSKCSDSSKFLKNSASIKGIEQNEVGSPFEGPLLATFDWRNKDGKNWLTPVKNQGSCGSCWAFSAVGVVESLYKINGSFADLDLSEENLVSDCFGGGSCCGGWHYEAFDFIKNDGITDEEYFPYADSYCECQNSSCSAETVLHQYNISDSGSILDSLRNFRDKKIKAEYVKFYYDYSPDIEKILVRDPLLAKDAVGLIIKYMPAVRYVIGDSKGQDLKINKADIEQITLFTEKLKNKIKGKNESGRLTKALELIEEFEIQFKAFDGKTFSQFFESSIYFNNNPKESSEDDEAPDCQCEYINIESGNNICSDTTCSDRRFGYELWKIPDWHSVTNSQDYIKRYLISKGPLSVAMGMGDDYSGEFNGGIYQCGDDSGVNHAVVIVGYNDKEGYWIVRNSWGDNWAGSDNGYFNVGYGECFIENHVYYADYADLAPYHLPNQPDEDDLGQSNFDDTTAIEVGSAIDEDAIIFKSRISHPDNLQVKLQVELRRLSEYDGAFNEGAGGLKESEFVDSGEIAVIYINNDDLVSGGYHWRAMVIDENGHKSGWIEFGKNDISDPDFTKILSVPYYHQGDTDWCVPTSMSMILQYYDKDIHSWDIAKDWEWERETGLFDFIARDKANKYFEKTEGVSSENMEIDFDTIKESINNDKPVLLAMREHFGMKHAVVITGYEENTDGSKKVYINDPSGAFINDKLQLGIYPTIGVPVDWEVVSKYAPTLPLGTSYAITVDGAPNPPKGTLNIDMIHSEGFYFTDEKYQDRPFPPPLLYSWAYGDDVGISWKLMTNTNHSLALNEKDMFKYGRYITNHTTSEQEYNLKMEFLNNDFMTPFALYNFPINVETRKSAITEMNLVSIRSLLEDEYGEYPIRLTLWNNDFTEEYDEIVFPSIEYNKAPEIGYAIIVAGQGGWLKEGIDHSANNAYRVLRNLGFNDDHIFYLNSNNSQDIDGSGDDEVDNPATYSYFKEAINDIKNKMGNNSSPLILYLVGHGDVNDGFIFDEKDFSNEGDLKVFQLRDELDKFSSETPMFIMFGSCHSGIFINSSVGISAKNRIIIASCRPDKITSVPLWVPRSDRFWKNLNEGLNVKESFVKATAPLYWPISWLDDNGDKIGSPPDDLGKDGSFAVITQIGIPDTENLKLATWHYLKLFSPGEIRIYDSQGNVTGLIGGEIKEEIPGSVYDEENHSAIILSPSDSYFYKVVGNEEGTYGLIITSVVDGEEVTFTATDIPTISNEVHQYSIDWQALANGEEGVTVEMDKDGDGEFEETFITGNTLDMGANMETQIAITKIEYDEGNDILSAITANVGDGLAPLLLSELKESQVDLEDYTPNGKLESGQKKKLKMKFKFLETAGNEYQGKSINVKFKFLGTQEEH